jgi:DNA mismatch repair protein MutS2
VDLLSTKFKKNDRVFVRHLKQEGVITLVLKTGEYRVAVRTFVFTCKSEDLISMREARSQRLVATASPLPRRSTTKAKLKKRVPSKTSLDLHGLRVEEALRLVEGKINEAIMRDLDCVEVVHGIGTGKLKQAIHAYLAKVSVVQSYRLDEANPGVTWVYF